MLYEVHLLRKSNQICLQWTVVNCSSVWPTIQWAPLLDPDYIKWQVGVGLWEFWHTSHIHRTKSTKLCSVPVHRGVWDADRSENGSRAVCCNGGSIVNWRNIAQMRCLNLEICTLQILSQMNSCFIAVKCKCVGYHSRLRSLPSAAKVWLLKLVTFSKLNRNLS